MSAPVLYDNPGPRARQRILIGSLVAAVLVAGLLAVVVLRLADRGQLTEEKWGPLLNPANPVFVAVWSGLLTALANNLVAAALAMIASLVVGTMLALTRITAAPWYRWLVVGGVELLRGLPVVVTIFVAYRALPVLGVNLPTLWYLVIGLTAYNAVIIAEIVRSGVAALPRGQAEAASALGLTRGQSLRMIQLPQAFRVMLPALISQLVVILKDTSLGFVILYPESVRFVRRAIQQLDNPIQMFFMLAVLFILINYALQKFAEWVERRLSRARRTAAPPTAGTGAPVPAGVGAAAGG